MPPTLGKIPGFCLTVGAVIEYYKGEAGRGEGQRDDQGGRRRGKEVGRRRANAPARGNSYKRGTAMAQATRNGRAKQPTKAELRQQLAEAQDRAQKAEGALLARPQTATPPRGGHAPEALQPAAEGVLRVWIMTAGE